MSKKDEKEGFSDVIKKAVSVGVGAAFMTEEAVRGVLKDLPLSKEIVSGLVENAKGAKEDFTKGFQEELRKKLSKVNISQLTSEILEKYDIDVTAKFSFTPKSTKGQDKNKENLEDK